jgi:polyribonucleotide nucleotidyltransferase
VQDVRTEVKEGDQILVKVVNIDPSGKIRLSRKALLEGGDAAAGSGGTGEPQPAGAYSDRGSHDGGHRSHGDRPRGDRDRGRGGDRGGRDRGGRPR